MFKKISYHVLSHDNSEDILLATNVFISNENLGKSFFKRINNDLFFVFNEHKTEGIILCELSNSIWDKIYDNKVLLVEFSAIGPIAEYEIVL